MTLNQAIRHLTPKQSVALAAILRGESYVEAARQAKVTYEAVYKWRKNNPRFQAALEAGKREIVGQAIKR